MPATAWGHIYWWSSFDLAVVFALMGARGVWFAFRVPEFVFRRREEYHTVLWLVLSATVIVSLIYPPGEVGAGLGIGRFSAAVATDLIAFGLWVEERRLLEWPTPRQWLSLLRMEDNERLKALGQIKARWGPRDADTGTTGD
jgi:hypothetical protein